MPTDYSSSNKVPKDGKPEEEAPKIKLESVVTGKVVVRKPGIGTKFKDLVGQIDFKDLSKHILTSVIFPYSQRMLDVGWSELGSRIIYPNAPRRPLLDPRAIGSAVQKSVINYGAMSSGNRNPVAQGALPRGAPPKELGPRISSQLDVRRPEFAERYDALRVLEQLRLAIDQYENTPISVANLYETMGRPDLIEHPHHKWGWFDLSDVRLFSTPRGFMLEFPPLEQIS